MSQDQIQLPEPDEFFVFADLDWHRATKGYFESSSKSKLVLYEAATVRRLIAEAVAAEREACALTCDALKAGTLEAQSGNADDLPNLMLRQVAVLGHQECATAIRSRGEKS